MHTCPPTRSIQTNIKQLNLRSPCCDIEDRPAWAGRAQAQGQRGFVHPDPFIRRRKTTSFGITASTSGKDWKAVSQAFNKYFHGRYRDGKAGLQCRFYRILHSAGTPAIGTLKRSNNGGQFSLLAWRRHRYPWMHSEHQKA